MADTLGEGSGRPGISRAIGDFTVAGVATRVLDNVAPADTDWGASPPPNGTLVFQMDGADLVLWIRYDDTWHWKIIDDFTAV